MRKLLRAMAKAEMERRGYSKVNPGFQGSKHPTRHQPVLIYPIPSWVKSWRDLLGVSGR